MHGSSMSPYDAEDLDAIQEKKGTIKEEIFINRVFKLDVYESLIKDRIYFVGVDVSNGYGLDNSAVTVWDPYNMRTVAEFKSPHIGVKDLIKFLYILIRKYMPNAILAIERNANGEAVLDHLRDSEIRGNLYFDNSKDFQVDDKLDGQGFIRQESARRRLYGIWTGGKSRETMFSLLDGYIKDRKDSFVGANIIDDIMKLVRKNDKIQAVTGQHDDSIMSFLMCLYMYHYGNNLSRYGFTRGVIPSEEDSNKGMNYGEIVAELSEGDKEFLGIDSSSIQNHVMEFDMRSMINEGRGLVTREELHNEISPNSVKKIKTPTMDPYTAKIYQEMMKAQRESENFNQRVGFVSGYRNIDETGSDDDYGFDLDIFDELNG